MRLRRILETLRGDFPFPFILQESKEMGKIRINKATIFPFKGHDFEKISGDFGAERMDNIINRADIYMLHKSIKHVCMRTKNYEIMPLGYAENPRDFENCILSLILFY